MQDEQHVAPTIEVGITVPVGSYPGDTFYADWNGSGPGIPNSRHDHCKCWIVWTVCSFGIRSASQSCRSSWLLSRLSDYSWGGAGGRAKDSGCLGSQRGCYAYGAWECWGSLSKSVTCTFEPKWPRESQRDTKTSTGPWWPNKIRTRITTQKACNTSKCRGWNTFRFSKGREDKGMDRWGDGCRKVVDRGGGSSYLLWFWE